MLSQPSSVCVKRFVLYRYATGHVIEGEQLVVQFDAGAAAIAHLADLCSRVRGKASDDIHTLQITRRPVVFMVELARSGDMLAQPMRSSLECLEKVCAQQPRLGVVASLMRKLGAQEVILRPDLAASAVCTIDGQRFRLAWLTFCNGMHHWGIGERTEGRPHAGWHHYDDLVGRSSNTGTQLLVQENGGFTCCMGYVRM